MCRFKCAYQLVSRTGTVQVITGGGSDSAQVVVTSPYIDAITNHTRTDARAKTDDLIQIDGDNFGLARNISFRVD